MILLVGADAALLEGLSQSLAALGYTPRVARELNEARELAAGDLPLIAVVQDVLAADRESDLLRVPLARGGAIVLFHTVGSSLPMFSSTMQRAVLADLALPLERQRLIALVQHVAERALVTGRGLLNTPPERAAR